MEQNEQQLKRFVWIDWMKTIGIYFIVLGHFFSLGDVYIYVFNGPLFFLISGFLSKIELSHKEFWIKIWNNLVVPMIIICLLNFIIDMYKNINQGGFTFLEMKYYVFNALIGMQSSLGTCWFIYTLIIIKIVYQYSYRQWFSFLIVVVLACLAYAYNNLDISPFRYIYGKGNSVLAVCVTYPAFFCGILFRRYKERLNSGIELKVLLLTFIICALLVLICGRLNGYVWIYRCGYGNNFLVYLIGIIAGSVCVYVVSKYLSGSNPNWMVIISKGTIIIMGFHPHLVMLIRKVFKEPSGLDIVWACLIVIAFIPVIMFAEKHFSIVLGKHRRLSV